MCLPTSLPRALAAAALAVGVVAAAASAQSGRSAVDLARDYVQNNKQQLGLTGSDINDLVVSSEVPSKSSGSSATAASRSTPAS